jgi:hypothetical protein
VRRTLRRYSLEAIIAVGYRVKSRVTIESWAESENDEIQNGLALCKNALWMFDEGLWSCRLTAELYSCLTDLKTTGRKHCGYSLMLGDYSNTRTGSRCDQSTMTLHGTEHSTD